MSSNTFCDRLWPSPKSPRVLRPTGLHVFTVPYSPENPTVARARPGQGGEVVLLAPAHYHGDPLNPSGVLVVTDWGRDLPEVVDEALAFAQK